MSGIANPTKDSSIEGLAALQRRFAAISGPVADHRLLYLLGQLGADKGKERYQPHAKTHKLGQTIRVGTITDDSVTILAGGIDGVGYARVLELGSQPHIIRPRNKKALAWGGARRLTGSLKTGATATNFATIVHHPGTRGVFYLRDGAKDALRDAGLAQFVVSEWNRAG